MAENFDVNLNDEVENFVVEFGEIQRITVDDFDKIPNRPSYDSQLMTHETNIPKVPANVSELNNDSDYQTGEEVAQALEAKQDKLTAGNNVQISEQNVISATDTVYSAGNGINISPQNELSVDTTVVATQQGLSNEVHNRENADNYLQGQIDAISASSDVVDIVGTYADLQNYDTQHLKDNDIIKVLQDETQGNATTYYRWSTSAQTFTLIGQEGPYYTKAGADAQFVPQTRTVNGKALSSNITLDASDVSALGPSSVVQTTGNSTSQIMSQKATTDALGTKLNASDYVVDNQLANSDNPVQNRVLNGLLGNMPSDFFSGEATTTPTASTEVKFGNILSLDDVQLLGDTYQQAYSGKNLVNANGTFTYGNTNYRTTSNGDGTITTTSKIGMLRSAGQKIEGLLPNTVYTLSATLISYDGSLTSGYGGQMEVVDSSSGSNIRLSAVEFGTIGSLPESAKLTFTTPADVSAIWVSFNGRTTAPSSSAPYPTLVMGELQLEKGSTVTSYEPYVGGVPAPNPDYPQTISVVTGVQTVTVSDGGSNTQTFTIDLGALELCKIGTYQDYIYKSGDDWYVHKSISKTVLNGSEAWVEHSQIHNNIRGFRLDIGTVASNGTGVLADRFRAVSWISYQAEGADGRTYGTITTLSTSGPYIYISQPDTSVSTLSSFQNWLSTHNTTVYYALATPTDTKITDATLISELEALLSASTYGGETDFVITATGTNLPAPLQLTAINANAKGLIERVRA